MALRIFREEKTMAVIGFSLRALPRIIISVQWGWQPRMISRKLCQPWLRCLFGCNMVVCGEVLLPTNRLYCEIPGRVVAGKLRHDAHLSASSNLSVLLRLWNARVQKES
ncbi:hypothetical protein EVAR_69285_1 [Eumeta japonica]|uniref:Uncharacterized protein n=1 Tax=Eumeta variegata TaxID=151549 RepID=A0A4C1SIZ3_EUMVA|nr:hypothetical protein EVAR_69285_1 [Eumeta japonica]